MLTKIIFLTGGFYVFAPHALHRAFSPEAVLTGIPLPHCMHKSIGYGLMLMAITRMASI